MPATDDVQFGGELRDGETFESQHGENSGDWPDPKMEKAGKAQELSKLLAHDVFEVVSKEETKLDLEPVNRWLTLGQSETRGTTNYLGMPGVMHVQEHHV